MDSQTSETSATDAADALERTANEDHRSTFTVFSEWVDANGIDLAECTVRFDEFTTNYSADKDEHGNLPLVRLPMHERSVLINVSAPCVPAETLRQFKRVFGKLKADAPPYVSLTARVQLPTMSQYEDGSRRDGWIDSTLTVKLTVDSAFTCEMTYNCTPKHSAALVSELTENAKMPHHVDTGY